MIYCANQSKQQYSNQENKQNSQPNIINNTISINNLQHSNKQQFSTLLNSQGISNQDNLKTTQEIENNLIRYIPSLIHDLKNPLQQIIACAEVYRTQLNQMQNPLYGILIKSVNHMSELITKALAIFQSIIESKDENKIYQLNYENVDISSYLEDFWTNNLAIAEQNQNVDYQIQVQSSLPHYVNIPKFEVTQIIQNLFSNASKFTNKGSIKLIVSFVELSEEDDCQVDVKKNDILNESKQQLIQSNKKFQNQDLNTQIQLIKNDVFLSENNNQQSENKFFMKQQNVQNQIDQDIPKTSFKTKQERAIRTKEFIQPSNLNYQKGGKLEQIQKAPISLNQITNSQINDMNNSNIISQDLKYMSDSQLPNYKHFNKKEFFSQKLRQKLQSITYQFDKLKYSQQSENDYYTNTDEDVNEDYLFSELNQEYFAFHSPSSIQVKQVGDQQKCFSSSEQNVNSSYGLIKKIPQNSNVCSSLTHLNKYCKVSQQPKNLLLKNFSDDSNNSEQNQQNYIQNFLSYNQIENNNLSCHNSTPSTFQIHTFSDISNSKNTNNQTFFKVQSLSSAKLTSRENSIANNDLSIQYHTPLTSHISYQNLRNTQLKGDLDYLQYQNNINQQLENKGVNNNFLIDFTSPDTESYHSQNTIETKNRKSGINQISSGLINDKKSFGNHKHSQIKRFSTLTPKIQKNYNPLIKIQNNKPASAEFEGSNNQLVKSTLEKQQKQNKQNQIKVQNSFSNQNLQLQVNKFNQTISGGQKVIKLNEISEKQKPESDEKIINHQMSQQKENIKSSLNNLTSSLSNTDLPSIHEYCQIFSKRKSQIHPSIRDLVFSRNNIRNYQVRKAAKIKGFLKFEILDTGKGMDKNEQAKIFDLYQQANNQIKGQYGGTGIGLFSAKNIANYLNGDIYCHSLEGVGSAFIFYMPCDAYFKTEINQENTNQNKQVIENQQKISNNQINQQKSQQKTEQDQFKAQTNIKLHQNINIDNSNINKQKFFQEKQQQQIMQIQQDLKNADSFSSNVDQQNKHNFIRQYSQNVCSFPCGSKEEELNYMLLQLEQQKKKINMIYIDDDQFLLQTMEIRFNKINFVNLTIENSALNGLQTIRQNPNMFDIALIDHEMPELNGKELAKEVKQINPNIILICHSGLSSSQEFMQQCIKSGFQYFLDKPCLFQHIILLLSQIYKISHNNLNMLNFS